MRTVWKYGWRLIVLGIAILIVLNWRAISTFPDLATGISARFACQCAYPMGNSHELCVKEDMISRTFGFTPVTISFDDALKRVTTTMAFGGKSQATWEPGYGCKLESGI